MPYKPGDITKGAASKAGEATLGVARSARRKVFDEASKRGVHWWQLPLPGQLAALALFREDLREFNLYGTESPRWAPSWPSRLPTEPTTGLRPILRIP